MLKRRVEGMESYSTHSNNINASPQILTAGSPDQIQVNFLDLRKIVAHQFFFLYKLKLICFKSLKSLIWKYKETNSFMLIGSL